MRMNRIRNKSIPETSMPRVTFRRSALSAAVAAIAVSATTQAHAQAAATPAA